MDAFESILQDGRELAIIVRNEFNAKGIHFFTKPSYSQQVAFMQHGKGHEIQAHSHKEVNRTVTKTNEVLIIRKGTLKVTIYDENQFKVCERNLYEGDLILLIAGGHGFEASEDVEFFEVKQGPYASDDDKIRF